MKGSGQISCWLPADDHPEVDMTLSAAALFCVARSLTEAFFAILDQAVGDNTSVYRLSAACKTCPYQSAPDTRNRQLLR